jgi:hypothetical protein
MTRKYILFGPASPETQPVIANDITIMLAGSGTVGAIAEPVMPEPLPANENVWPKLARHRS